MTKICLLEIATRIGKILYISPPLRHIAPASQARAALALVYSVLRKALPGRAPCVLYKALVKLKGLKRYDSASFDDFDNFETGVKLGKAS